MPRVAKVSPDFFNVWSRDLAYLLGYIVGDGNITDVYGKRSLRIHSKDSQILDDINSIFGSVLTRTVEKKDNFTIGVLHFYSRPIINRLRELGIPPSKSIVGSSPDIPSEFYSDYLRGLFDSDGSVWNKRETELTLGFYGHEKTLLPVQSFLIKQGLYLKMRDNRTVKSLETGDRNKIERIRGLMYADDPTLLLKRKKLVIENREASKL